GSLLAVRSPLGNAWLLAEDEPPVRAAETASAPARLLPSGDAYFLPAGPEPDLLAPRAAQRDRLWTPRAWPGALLVEGELAGTWGRVGGRGGGRSRPSGSTRGRGSRGRRATRSRPRRPPCRCRDSTGRSTSSGAPSAAERSELAR